MASIHFFTKEESITTNQIPEWAYGAQPDQANVEVYNLDNRFGVVEGAAAFATVKAQLIAVESQSNSSLLNIALAPINNFLGGFPVKYIIYRGINKAALVGGNDEVLTEDSSWDSNNILKIIKKLQDDINEKSGTNETAKSTSLGIQFSTAASDTYLDRIFYNDVDDFHPLVVPAGCQIGKFAGGATAAGIEIVLDNIGNDPTLALLRANNHVFTIDKLNLNGLSEGEAIKQKFSNRYQKETILSYLDVTALYGACKNQGIAVKKALSGDDFLRNFKNKNVVYIDLRDNRGFSYNHFFKFEDELNIGFYPTGNDAPTYTAINYYDGWPILALHDRIYENSNKKRILIKVPIIIGSPVNVNLISSFVGKIGTELKAHKERHKLLALNDEDENIILKESEALKCDSWAYSNNKLGANYFLLKKSTLGTNLDKEYLSSIWNAFFSLKMLNVFGTTEIPDGEFRVKTYSSLFAPVRVNKVTNEVYQPQIGIAADKFHITFFAYYDEKVYQERETKYAKLYSTISTGKFNPVVETDNLTYDEANQGIGFLYKIVGQKEKEVSNFELTKYGFPDPDDATESVEVLVYSRNGELRKTDDSFQHFESITLTHDEYNHLKSLETAMYSDPDYITGHPLYLKSKAITYKTFPHLDLATHTLTLGVAKRIAAAGSTNYVVDLLDFPEDITINNELITISAAVTNS